MNLLAATSTGNLGHQKLVVCGVLACTVWFLSRNFVFSYFISLTFFFLSEMKKLKIKLCEMVFLGSGSVFSSFYKQRLSPVGGGNEICESNPSCAAGLRAVVHSRNESGFLAFHWASKEMQKACFF